MTNRDGIHVRNMSRTAMTMTMATARGGRSNLRNMPNITTTTTRTTIARDVSAVAQVSVACSSEPPSSVEPSQSAAAAATEGTN